MTLQALLLPSPAVLAPSHFPEALAISLLTPPTHLETALFISSDCEPLRRDPLMVSALGSSSHSTLPPSPSANHSPGKRESSTGLSLSLSGLRTGTGVV